MCFGQILTIVKKVINVTVGLGLGPWSVDEAFIFIGHQINLQQLDIYLIIKIINIIMSKLNIIIGINHLHTICAANHTLKAALFWP